MSGCQKVSKCLVCCINAFMGAMILDKGYGMDVCAEQMRGFYMRACDDGYGY